MACWRCGAEGEQYPGPPRAALLFWRASAIWALHRMRQTLEQLGRRDRAVYISALTRDFEGMTEDTNPADD